MCKGEEMSTLSELFFHLMECQLLCGKTACPYTTNILFNVPFKSNCGEIISQGKELSFYAVVVITLFHFRMGNFS